MRVSISKNLKDRLRNNIDVGKILDVNHYYLNSSQHAIH
jgi:hypothetical protein